MSNKASPSKTWTLKEAMKRFLTDEDRAAIWEFDRQKEEEFQRHNEEQKNFESAAHEKSGEQASSELKSFVGKDLKAIGAMSPLEIKAAIEGGIPYDPYDDWFLNRANYLKNQEIFKNYKRWSTTFAKEFEHNRPEVRGLIEALRTGNIIAWGTMDEHQGEIEPIPESRWNGAWRFIPDRNTAESMDNGWLTFFRLAITERPTPIEAAPDASPKLKSKDQGGRPQTIAWGEIDDLFLIDLATKGMPETKEEAKKRYEECAATLYKNPPSESAIRKHLSEKYPYFWAKAQKGNL